MNCSRCGLEFYEYEKTASEIKYHRCQCASCIKLVKSLAPSRDSAYGHCRYLANRDRQISYSLSYRAVHPEKERCRSFMESNRIHRRRYVGVGAAGHLSLEEWEKILADADYKCLACGAAVKLTIDHIKPLPLGGRNIADNVQPLCRSCNARKGGRTIDYRDKSCICGCARKPDHTVGYCEVVKGVPRRDFYGGP